MQISYNIEGDLSNIDNLKIRFIHELSNLENYIEQTIENYGHFEQIIPLPDDIDNSSKIHIRLEVTYANESSYRSNIHSAIFLESIESLSEACDYAINAKWSNYAIYPPPYDDVPQLPPIFNEVQVLMYDYDEDNNTCNIEDWHLIFTLPQQTLGDSEEVIDLSDIDDILGGLRYCFRVKAINNESNIESYSNMLKHIELEELMKPSRPEIISADVVNNEAIVISVEVDENGSPQFVYTLQRSDNIETGFEDINQVTYSGSEIIFYDDDIPHFESNPWYYLVVADMRDCPMLPPPTSIIVSSIGLKPDVDFQPGLGSLVVIEFEWKHFDTDGGYTYSLIEELPEQERVIYSSSEREDTHIETIDLEQLATDIKYYVRAIHPNLDDPIRSNFFTFSPEWLKPPPNAFRPGSSIEVNQKFTPEFYFETGIDNFSLSIFDRNGLRLYYTEQIGEGWNGDIQATGQPAPGGAYIYEIRFDRAEKPVRGVVYLVR